MLKEASLFSCILHFEFSVTGISPKAPGHSCRLAIEETELGALPSIAPRVIAQACTSSRLDATKRPDAARAGGAEGWATRGHSRKMSYPNRAQWRMIELLVVTVAIGWVLTSPTEDPLTRLIVGLTTFAAMLLIRSVRP